METINQKIMIVVNKNKYLKIEKKKSSFYLNNQGTKMH